MAPATLARIADGNIPKGDVLATARLAGIQAAKRTQDWIPLCHPIPLDSVEVELPPEPDGSKVGAIRVAVPRPPARGEGEEACQNPESACLHIPTFSSE